MKHSLLPVLLLVILCACSVQKSTNNASGRRTNPVIAHRGAFKKNNLPENSIASLREAVRLECAGSEFDVRMTADDSLIINHDPRYATLEIEKTTYQQLIATPLKNGEKLPTLREYLQAGKQRNPKTLLVLEIKPSGISKERGQRIAQKSLALVKEVGVAAYTVYISFDYDILIKVVQLNPGANTQYLNGDKTPEQLKEDGIKGADYNFSIFRKNPEWIERAKQNGIVLNAWTVNDKDEMQRLLGNGFTYLTTNEPELLFSIWRGRSRTSAKN